MNSDKIAASGQLELLDEDALSHECAKLDPCEERAFADMELLNDISEWPAY